MHIEVTSDQLRLIRRALVLGSNHWVTNDEETQGMDDLLDALPEPFDNLGDAIADNDRGPGPVPATRPRGRVHRHEVTADEWADLQDRRWATENGGL